VRTLALITGLWAVGSVLAALLTARILRPPAAPLQRQQFEALDWRKKQAYLRRAPGDRCLCDRYSLLFGTVLDNSAEHSAVRCQPPQELLD
jgi:hypothetical protein